MTDRELKIIIKADGSVAIGEINKLDKTFEGLGGKTEKTQGKLTKLSQAILGTGQSATKSSQEVEKATTTWNEFATGINQAWESLGKVKRVFESGWDMAKQGAQLQEARASFEDYSRSVGRNSDEIISKLKKASGGTIGDLQLITTASKAMSLGVTQDADKMANLLEVARNKARLFGMETTDAFNDIVIGIGRGSPLILDNLGIRIPAGFEEMSKGMTDADKTAKLLELTLIEGNKQLDEMGGLSNTTADELRAFEAAITNLKGEFGILLAEAFTPYLDSLRYDLIPATRDFIKELKIAKEVMDVPGQILATLYYDKDIKKYPDNLEDAQNKFYEVNDQITAIRRRMAEIKPAMSTESWLIDTTKYKIGAESYIGLNKESEELQKYADELEQLIVGLDAAKKKAAEKWEISGPDVSEVADEIDSIIDDLDTMTAGFETTTIKAKKTSTSVKSLKADFAAFGASAIKDLDLMGDGFDQFADDMDKLLGDFGDAIDDIKEIREIPPELKKFNEEIEELTENKKALDDVLATLKDFASFDFAETLDKINPSDFADQRYAASMTAGMANLFSGGLLTTDYSLKFVDVAKKDKDQLSKTIAEAVTTGFANADFSNLELTLGNVLSSILTKSVSQANPVMSASGAINWGNLGTNLAVSAVSQVLTRPGRFFGGREEHGKESIQQATDLKSRMGEAYADSFIAEITSVYAGKAMKEAIASARRGYTGTSVGYSWSDSGDGIFSDRTRTYATIDNGASAALEKLTKAMEAAEEYSKNVELSLKLQSAQGYEYKVLREQITAYEQSLEKIYSGTAQLKWGDGSTGTKADLTEATSEIKTELAQMLREFASATAERSTKTAMGFMQYAPWLENIRVMYGDSSGSTPGSHLRANMLFGGSDGYDASVSRLSRDEYYDSFERLQNDFSDRKISSGLIDVVKGSGQARYDLEALQITDPEAYDEKYLEYIDRQLEAYDEVMERQAEIFNNESKSFEERAAALENYETSMEVYHQAKLDKLRLEKAQEEEEKRIMAEQRQAKMEAALSLVGEVAQRGDRIVILQGGDSTTALKELLEKFSDDPEVSAILQAAITNNEAKARWGN